MSMENHTQTTWNIKLNKAIQTQLQMDYQDIEDDNNDILCIFLLLLEFLQNVYPLMEEALQSNETIDVF
jgi:hypothetical protein